MSVVHDVRCRRTSVRDRSGILRDRKTDARGLATCGLPELPIDFFAEIRRSFSRSTVGEPLPTTYKAAPTHRDQIIRPAQTGGVSLRNSGNATVRQH